VHDKTVEMPQPAHHLDCDCTHHRAQRPSDASGRWASVLPLLACAVCPACLSAYAKIFSAFGVGLVLTEAQHTVILTLAVVSSVGVSTWRSFRSRRAWPVVVAMVGASLVVAGHVAEVPAAEWAGVVVLLAGGLVEMPLVRKLLGRLKRASMASAEA
jgi:hypothetical protein